MTTLSSGNFLYVDSLDINNYNFRFKTADFINRWTGLNIPNSYSYNSEDDFIFKQRWHRKRLNLLNSSVSLFGNKLGGSADIELAPGFLEAGFNVQAGYNLGEFNFDIPFSASISAGLVDQKLSIDVDADLNLPRFNYINPFAYAYLDAVLGYDVQLDASLQGYVETFFYDGDYNNNFKILDLNRQTSPIKRLVQLDTRKNNNFIDLIFKKIEFGGDNNASVSRQDTGGYVELDFDLPKFNGSFNPISTLNEEYVWQLKEEKELITADFALDSLLQKIPWLYWISGRDGKAFSVLGKDFNFEYEWRTFPLDLSASLNFGYDFQIGIKDLYPQILAEKSEITVTDLSIKTFETNKDLLDFLETHDKDNEGDIDLVIEFNPSLIFDAYAYLKPSVNLDWDIGYVSGQLSPVIGKQEFTLIEGNEIDLCGGFCQEIPIVDQDFDVTFKELYGWLKSKIPSLPNLQTEYTIEIPFDQLLDVKVGTDGSDYFYGTPGDDPPALLKGGNDVWLLSEGNDGVDGGINGGNGTDTLILVRPASYTLSSTNITDSKGNETIFESFELLRLLADGSPSGLQIMGDLNDDNVPIIYGITTHFDDRIINKYISNIQTRKGDDYIEGKFVAQTLDTGEGNDFINISSSIETNTKIRTGTGEDLVFLTIVPSYTSTFTNPKLVEIELETGYKEVYLNNDAIDTSSGGSPRRVNVLVTGHIGGKIIDSSFTSNSYRADVILDVQAPLVRNLFGLEANTEVDNLFIDIKDSELIYRLDNTHPDAVKKSDLLLGTINNFTLDLSNSKLSPYIKYNPKSLDGIKNNFIIDSGNLLTEILIDHSGSLPPRTPTLVVNGNKTTVKLNELNFLNILEGDFTTLDLSGVPLDEGTGVVELRRRTYLPGTEVIFTDGRDTLLFNGSFSTPSTTVGLPHLRDPEEFRYFYLGGGDDRFHDRPGFRDSAIYPGSGNNFIYGEGGYDTVYYEEGSRIDYTVTVVDDRTVEVHYQKDGTTDTLIDVEEIDFSGADELIENPYYQGPDPSLGFTTFTLQLFKDNNWEEPPFIYAPFTYLVPFATTEITLTKDFLLTNVYDPQGNDNQLEISYIDVYASPRSGLSSKPQLDTTNPSADVWKVTIPEGLNNDKVAVVIDYMVDSPGGYSQGNFLEIYASSKLSSVLINQAINLTGSSVSESIEGTEFDDIISGGDGDDFIQGFGGDDLLNGDQGDDELEGNQGKDTLNGGQDNDFLVGGENDDLLNGGPGDDMVNGGEGNDVLEGGEGQDVLDGGIGNDQLDGGIGSDILLGGLGNNTYTLQAETAAASLIEDIGDFDTLILSNGDLTLNNAQSGIIGLIKDGNNLVIDLNQDGVKNSNDDLTIIKFFDNSGNAGDGIIENLDNLFGAEVLTLFNNNNDGNGELIIGTNARDTLIGGNGDDTLQGLGDKDWLDGGAGADLLEGGDGDDTYIVDNAGDLVSETNPNQAGGKDLVKSSLDFTLPDNVENLIINGDAINGVGNSLNNKITGNNGNNYLTGNDGNDDLKGKKGDDTLDGGAGNDFYTVNSANDKVIDSSGNDTIKSTVDWILGDDIEKLILVGKNNLNGTGNTSNNTIKGNDGTNTLVGGDGDDTLTGGKGNDILIGGAGVDFFNYMDEIEGVDTITDFNVADDTILVTGNKFSSDLVRKASITEAQFNLGNSATTPDHRFIYNSDNGIFWFDPNGSNSGGAVQLATLPTGLNMTHENIYVV